MAAVVAAAAAAEALVQGLARPHKLGVTVDDLASVHHPYPSFGEGLNPAAEQASATS